MQTKSSTFVRHAYDFSPYAEGMEAMRSTWTDERLDDLRDEVIRQGGRIDHQSERIDTLGARIDKQSERIDALSDALNERIDALNQTILTIGGRLFAASIAFTVAIVGLIATQL
jgi:hypothetical protein